MRWILFVVVGCSLSSMTLAEPPQTGPETENRFPPLKVPEGFKATLFACDPLIEYPSAIALGPRANTLFVAVDYMTGLGTTDIIRRDEIRLVEDTDGDGYADKSPVWADGFNSIQGLTYHDGTVFVMHAPYLTALRDTDGDGEADERRNLFQGFGLGPEEDKVRLHNTNGIVAGYDGWLYLALGDRGCDVVRPEGDLLILNGGGILRCRPDGRDLHVFSTGLRNIYDVALDEDLNVFTRDNENDGGNYKIRVCQSFFGADHGYPYLYDERPDEALAPLADLGLGSSAGGIYYRETQFPPEYRGLYFCEWGRAVMRYVPHGIPFGPLKEIEFASGAENDPYGFKPTDLVVDRDGSLLIADWADGQRPKRGRARIYRVQSVTGTRSSEHSDERVPATRVLNSDSYYERLESQLMIERQFRHDPAGVVELLQKANLNERGWLHGVWILAHVLGPGATDELFKLATLNELPRVQIQAIRALADLHDPVLTEHRLDAGPGDVKIAKRLAGSMQWHGHMTLDVIVALGRLKWAQTPFWMSQDLRNWRSPPAVHAAQQTLRRCGDWLAVLRLLDEPLDHAPPAIALVGGRLNRDPTQDTEWAVSLRSIALRALADQADKQIVDGLEVRIRLANEPARRREYAELLSRVHRKPGPWVYWGFRPGPRPANTVAWERTEFIEQTLDRLLVDPDASVRLTVLQRMQREKIPTRLTTLAMWLRDETQPKKRAEILATRLGDEAQQKEQALILTSLREHPAHTRREILESFITDLRQSAPTRMTALSMWCEGLGADRETRLLDLAQSLIGDRALADLLRELCRQAAGANPKTAISPEALTLLRNCIGDAHSTVRATAIELLANLRVAEAADIVPKLLKDAGPDVRLAAAVAAGQLEVRDTVPGLLANAGSDLESPEMRQACLDSLRQLREPRVVPLAVVALSNSTTQLSALRCLAEFGGPDQAAAVIEAANRNSNSEVVSLAVQMLSRCAVQEGLAAERRAEFEQAMLDLQGTSGALVRWQISEPMSADEATKLAESIGNVGQSSKWSTMFGTGTETRVREGEAPAEPLRAKPSQSPDSARREPRPPGIMLAFADFNSAEPVAAQVLMSSNSAWKVWFNGKQVFDRTEVRRFQADADRFEAELAKGTNRLLILLSSVPDTGFEFHARVRRKSSKAEHERLVEAALTRPGNVERGRKLFLTVEKSQCLKCHRLGEQGEKIGPELTGIGSRFSRIHIVESLLDPSRTIAAGFQSQAVAMQDGRVLSGLKISETADTLVLADNQGKKHSLRKADIEESQAHSGSIMPDGLEKTLTVDEFVDLIAFLVGEKQSAVR